MACEQCTHNCLCLHLSLILKSDGASFFKVMTGNFSAKLEIPADFIGRMNIRVFKGAILTGPSGHLWHVNFRCTGVSAYFGHGWEGFVTDNRIKAKDILIFRRAGDKYFVVQVFGAIEREHEQNDKILSVNRSQLSCEIIEIVSEDSSPSTSGAEIVSEDSSPSTSGAVPNVEASEAFAVPNPVKITEPMFPVILTKCAISKPFVLGIPHDFGERWLPNKNVELIFLHHKNPGQWQHMLGVYRPRHGGRRYVVYWKRFVIDNDLHKGDKCVLQLINGDKYMFMIYVNT